MADRSPTAGAASSPAGKGFEPEVPITTSPMFDWPPRPVATLRYLVTPVMLPYGIFWVVLAALTWNYLTPSMERMASLRPGWMLQIYVRNALLLIAMAGTLHLALYVRRAQQQRYKYNRQWMSTTNQEFLWTNQTRDNVFWSLVSGVTVWTAYESLTMWFYANDWIPRVEWSSAWPYLSALTVGVFMWSVTHFYLNHRLLHVRWFYDHAHYLHHRNVNTGPWTGISMHPLEHLIYFSVLALWWVVPAHPFIVILGGLFQGGVAGGVALGVRALRGRPARGAQRAGRRLLPPSAPPLLRVQLRQPARAHRQAVRHLPRRHPRGPRPDAPTHEGPPRHPGRHPVLTRMHPQ